MENVTDYCRYPISELGRYSSEPVGNNRLDPPLNTSPGSATSGWRTSTLPGRTVAPRLGSGSRPGPQPVLRRTWRGRRSCPQPGRTKPRKADRRAGRQPSVRDDGSAQPATFITFWWSFFRCFCSLLPCVLALAASRLEVPPQSGRQPSSHCWTWLNFCS